MEKRTFLKLFVVGTGLVGAGVIGIPALATIFSPVIRRARGERWQPLGELEAFPVGAVQRAEVDLPRTDWARALRVQGVYVWRQNAGEVIVFSRSCTDLSCPVTWDAGSGWFFCPCHGGIFNHEGERMAGPPKRALYRYATRIREGMIEIDLNSIPPMA
jgi:menaquinol-cytochrome c reductase iron-sulfur subunit